MKTSVLPITGSRGRVSDTKKLSAISESVSGENMNTDVANSSTGDTKSEVLPLAGGGQMSPATVGEASGGNMNTYVANSSTGDTKSEVLLVAGGAQVFPVTDEEASGGNMNTDVANSSTGDTKSEVLLVAGGVASGGNMNTDVANSSTGETKSEVPPVAGGAQVFPATAGEESGEDIRTPLLCADGSAEGNRNSPHVASGGSGCCFYNWNRIHSGVQESNVNCLGCCMRCWPRNVSPTTNIGGLSSSSMSTGEGDGRRRCLTNAEKERIETLEKTRTDLLNREIELDKRCDDIDMSVIHTTTLSVVMLGAGTVCGVVLSPPRILYTVLGMLVLAYSTVVGMGTIAGFKKLKKLKWHMTVIKYARVELKRDAEVLAGILRDEAFGILMIPSQSVVTVAYGRFRVRRILDTLESNSGSYKKDHMTFIIMCLVASVAYLIAIGLLMYLMHAGDKLKNLNIFGTAI